MTTNTTPEGPNYDPAVPDAGPNPPTSAPAILSGARRFMCQSVGTRIVTFYALDAPSRPFALTFPTDQAMADAWATLGWQEGTELAPEAAELLAEGFEVRA